MMKGQVDKRSIMDKEDDKVKMKADKHKQAPQLSLDAWMMIIRGMRRRTKLMERLM